MSSTSNVKLPTHLVLTSLFSSTLTLIISICYTTLSILALVYRYQCDAGNPESATGSEYFMNIVYRVYIQREGCDFSESWEGLTHVDSIFVLVWITLVASILCLISASILITATINEESSRQVHIVAYAYIGICFGSLVVDLTFASHLGIDYSYLSEQLDMSSAGLGMNYSRDVVRLGALLLMTISMKGFVAHAVNIALLVLLAVFIVQHQKIVQKDQHSIHKMGALSAYEQQRRRDDSWQPQPELFLAMPRSQHVNPSFIDDDSSPRTPMREREPPITHFPSYYDRSTSWQAGPVSGARPFSYLEEPKPIRPMPTRPPPSPTAPPVPAPDYSPQPARRLKSALKPAYM